MATATTTALRWLTLRVLRSIGMLAAWHLLAAAEAAEAAAAAAAAGVHPTSVPLCLGRPDPEDRGREGGPPPPGGRWVCEIAWKAPRANFCIPLHSARRRRERGTADRRLLDLKGLKGMEERAGDIGWRGMAVTARAGIRALSSTSSIPSDASFWGPLGGGDGVVVCFSESPLAPSVPPSLPRPSLPLSSLPPSLCGRKRERGSEQPASPILVIIFL